MWPVQDIDPFAAVHIEFLLNLPCLQSISSPSAR